MPRLATLFLLLVLCPLTLLAPGCGSSNPRQMQSISVNPATADSQTIPNGEVQFTATGNFNKPPLTETPVAVAWAVSDSTIAAIDSSGVAQCVAGASGKATITGSLTVEPLNGQMGSKLTGTAQLTCP